MLVQSSSERGETITYVDFQLDQFFEVSQFLEIYKSLPVKVKGVYAIEDKEESIQVVEATSDVFGDVQREYNNYGPDLAFGVRIQTFRNKPRNMMIDYRDELVKQAQPVRSATQSINLGPYFKSAASAGDVEEKQQIVSPFANVESADNASVEAEGSAAFGQLSKTAPLELTVENVDKVLNKIRPYLIADGGNVAVVDVDSYERSIKLTLQGACGSCPSSTVGYVYARPIA